MKSNLIWASMVVMSVLSLASCQAVGDVFRAGMWVGVIVVVLIIALVLWLIGKMRK